jgi:hypothetical protein
MTTATPREVADSIAEAVRSLNYLTGAGGGPVALEYPGDVYDVIASLKVAAYRLPQLFSQMSRWLEQQAAAGRVAHDSGAAAGEHVADLVQALGLASHSVMKLGEDLNTAHSACGGLKAVSSGNES